ncbi:hypothetical protein RCL1_001375 [Eukaryota sp. TZLM3-RCL]
MPKSRKSFLCWLYRHYSRSLFQFLPGEVQTKCSLLRNLGFHPIRPRCSHLTLAKILEGEINFDPRTVIILKASELDRFSLSKIISLFTKNQAFFDPFVIVCPATQFPPVLSRFLYNPLQVKKTHFRVTSPQSLPTNFTPLSPTPTLSLDDPPLTPLSPASLLDDRCLVAPSLLLGTCGLSINVLNLSRLKLLPPDKQELITNELSELIFSPHRPLLSLPFPSSFTSCLLHTCPPGFQLSSFLQHLFIHPQDHAVLALFSPFVNSLTLHHSKLDNLPLFCSCLVAHFHGNSVINPSFMKLLHIYEGQDSFKLAKEFMNSIFDLNFTIETGDELVRIFEILKNIANNPRKLLSDFLLILCEHVNGYKQFFHLYCNLFSGQSNSFLTQLEEKLLKDEDYEDVYRSLMGLILSWIKG